MSVEQVIHKKFLLLDSVLDERSRRRWAASEAQALGYGGKSVVSRATGICHETIRKGMQELGTPVTSKRLRKEGAGRKSCLEKDKTLERDLDGIIEPTARGDPQSPLRYTIKSVRVLAKELKAQGHKVGYTTVALLLNQKEYSLQANNKKREGTSHPDRNAQFEFINADVKKQMQEGEPVISVDTKKKELVGDFANKGKEWRPKGKPIDVRVHDFELPGLGKVAPYGVYDLQLNQGWVNLGIDSDTAEFAVESIRRWWNKIGKPKYPNATKLTITADCGGSNSYRNRLWKYELQKLANEINCTVNVHHFPPGTSKWNKIEHRLFSFISQNWRGKPLLTHATIIKLITATTTTTGLKVDCVLDTNKYPTGKKITDEQYSNINLQTDQFHGEWNYKIEPNNK